MPKPVVTALAALFLTAPVAGYEIQLSACNRYPAVDKAAVRYRNNGPALYGAWYYDLVYRRERTVILQGVCERPVVRSETLQKHFELPENFGKPAELLRDVKAYLASHEVEKCTSRD